MDQWKRIQGTEAFDGEDLLDLIESLQDAVLDGARWQDFIARLASAFGACAGLLSVHDLGGSGLRVSESWIDESAARSGLCFLRGTHPWAMDGVAGGSAGVLIDAGRYQKSASAPVIGLAAVGDSPFEVSDPGPLRLPPGVARSQAMITRLLLLVPPAVDVLEPGRRGLLQRLLPPLSRALRLRLHLEALRHDLAATLRSFDRLPHGVFVLDLTGRVSEMNRGARTMVEQGDRLLLEKRRLVARNPQDDRLLQAELERVLDGNDAGEDGEAGILRLHGDRGRPPLTLLPSSVRGRGEHTTGGRTAAFVYALDPAHRVSVSPAHLCQLYELTAAEARVTALMAAGLNVAEAAEQLQINQGTVRAHLKRIFFKTHARSQADLLRILLTGPVAVGMETLR